MSAEVNRNYHTEENQITGCLSSQGCTHPWNRTKHTKSCEPISPWGHSLSYSKGYTNLHVPSVWKKGKCCCHLKKKKIRTAGLGSRELQATKITLSPWENYLASPRERHFYTCEGQEGDLEQSAQIYKIALEQRDYLL